MEGICVFLYRTKTLGEFLAVTAKNDYLACHISISGIYITEPKSLGNIRRIIPSIRAPPVLNFDFFKIQNKEDSYGYQKAEAPYR